MFHRMWCSISVPIKEIWLSLYLERKKKQKDEHWEEDNKSVWLHRQTLTFGHLWFGCRYIPTTTTPTAAAAAAASQQNTRHHSLGQKPKLITAPSENHSLHTLQDKYWLGTSLLCTWWWDSLHREGKKKKLLTHNVLHMHTLLQFCTHTNTHIHAALHPLKCCITRL